MNLFDSKSKSSVRALGNIVLGVKPTNARFAAGIIANDLMRPQWSLRIAARVMMWRNKCSAQTAWFTIFTKHPKAGAEAIIQFVNHIWNGKDTYEVGSAGGLSSGEIDTTVRLLHEFAGIEVVP